MILQLPELKKATVSETDDELKPRVESRDDGVFWSRQKLIRKVAV
jgi:putative DNA primase/helicase